MSAGTTAHNTSSREPQLPASDNLRLSPVLTVMVAGHRQSRLNRNRYHPGNPSLPDTLSQLLRCLRHTASQVFAQGIDVYHDQPPLFRLLTGAEDGVDRLAARIAPTEQFSLQLLIPGHAEDADLVAPKPDRAVALGMHSTGPRQSSLGQRDYNLRDRLALNFSDVLIAVLDGNEPFPMTSGAALAVKEALLRRKPVIWVALNDTGQPPVYWLNAPDRLTDAALAELDVLGATPELMRTLFVQVSGPTPEHSLEEGLRVWFEGLLTPFLDAANANSEEQTLRNRIARQPGLLRFVSSWLTYGWRSLTSRQQPGPRPINPVAFLHGSVLWIRMMLDPPRRSPGLQILDYLNTELREFSWGENTVSRAHGFLSGLLKLAPKRAWRALRQPRVKQAPDTDPERPYSAPIKDERLQQCFSWADSQARFFATRYQDDTWIIYYAAASAVFCAVAGAIGLWPAGLSGWGLTWVLLEILLLRLVIGKVLVARFKGLHQQWTSYRYLTEQLRLLTIGLPLLTLPSGVREGFWRPVSDIRAGAPSRPDNPIYITQPDAWLLQRILITEGLSTPADNETCYRVTNHNPAILGGLHQALNKNQRYFSGTYHRLHRDDHYLHRFALALFALTFTAVLMHLLFSLPGILFFTAFLPAWGAAIHGILAQNEVSRVAAMSAQTWHKLETLDTALSIHQTVTDTGIRANDQALKWARTQELRHLSRALVDILDDENRQWVSLLSHNTPELPG